ncbi:MAG: hypothetical protein NTW67_02245 [Candidatus Woesearchaeota archaeon]|nr:hypothetical protein [Candidatus Woesearchaeota archaeon]
MNKHLKDILFVIGIIVILTYLYFSISPILFPRESSVGITKLYKTVQDENVLIDIEDCFAPNEIVGIKCCIRDKTVPTMCQEEYAVFFAKVNNAARRGILTKEETIVDSYGYSFKPPKDYLLIENLTWGGTNVPYSLIAHGENENDYIFITIREIETTMTKEKGWGFDTKKDFASFEQGLKTGTSKAADLLNLNIKTETSRLVKTENDYDVFIIESKGEYRPEEELPETYFKRAIFLDRAFVLTYESSLAFSSYVNEFDELLNSFRFN